MLNLHFIVAVAWKDAAQAAGTWHHRDSIDHTPAHCVSVGHVAQWDDTGISLAISAHGESFGCIKFIPAGCITNVRVLETGRLVSRPDLPQTDGKDVDKEAGGHSTKKRPRSR
jgi:hypothetical protein